jgi:hypothetical protein
MVRVLKLIGKCIATLHFGHAVVQGVMTDDHEADFGLAKVGQESKSIAVLAIYMSAHSLQLEPELEGHVVADDIGEHSDVALAPLRHFLIGHFLKEPHAKAFHPFEVATVALQLE